jgi:hypothetical protein
MHAKMTIIPAIRITKQREQKQQQYRGMWGKAHSLTMPIKSGSFALKVFAGTHMHTIPV